MSLQYVYEEHYALTPPSTDYIGLVDGDPTVQGHYVKKELMLFAREVVQLPEYRGTRFFCPGDSSKGARVNTLYCFLPGSLVADFYIAHRGMGHEQTSFKYCFTTDEHIHKRIKYDSYKARTKASVNLDTLLRYMRKNRPPAYVDENINRVCTPFIRAVNMRRHERTQASEAARIKLSDMARKTSGKLLDELMTLYDSGYEFKHKEVEAKLKGIRETQGEENESLRDMPDKFDMVAFLPRIANDMSERMVMFTPNAVINRGLNQIEPASMTSTTVCPVNDLPPATMRGLMILQATKHDTLIESVGYRLNDDMYYVFTSLLEEPEQPEQAEQPEQPEQAEQEPEQEPEQAEPNLGPNLDFL